MHGDPEFSLSGTSKVVLFEGVVLSGAGWGVVSRIAAREPDITEYAQDLRDLVSSPGNRLEALRGNLAGVHSIRINDRWRVALHWTDLGPAEVDIKGLPLGEK